MAILPKRPNHSAALEQCFGARSSLFATLTGRQPLMLVLGFNAAFAHLNNGFALHPSCPNLSTLGANR